MKTYTFDTKLFAAISVDAVNEKQARKKLDKLLENVSLHLPDGQKVDVSQDDGEQELIEINGEWQ
jgi:hypothetical protein